MSKKKKKEIPVSVIRNKTIKIFVFRKIIEILLVIAFIFVPYILGYIVLGKESALCGDGRLLDKYSIEWSPKSDTCAHSYFARWGVGIALLFAVAIIIFLIIVWVKWNWEEAEFKAKDKLGYFD